MPPAAAWACGCCVVRRRRKGGDAGEAGGGAGASGRAGEGEEWSLFMDQEVLEAATANFDDDNLLGRGGFGPVYKGVLENGQEIAVKKLSLGSRQGLREFLNEVRLLLKVQHRNLVSLLGCCASSGQKMLVYPYFPNGSLDHILFGHHITSDQLNGPCIDQLPKELNLVDTTWKLFEEGRSLEIVDPSMPDWDAEQALLCIQLGLLCCQIIVPDRPDMQSVHLMLSSDSFTLPKPGKPAIHGRTGRWMTTTTSASASASGSTNTNTATTFGTDTNTTRASALGMIAEDESRNSISISFTTEGR
ncbi:hypothetical protein EJB05_31790 [Eragrostis curvula]|uniref:Protein kinase domain-containing protein n=1 Tax=Eragrostis curvula TaxID=38414 RepID=A0A5J9UG44_9POAL|nr:hypothetical protein EJB05_31790 [Eragrostis curvula]